MYVLLAIDGQNLQPVLQKFSNPSYMPGEKEQSSHSLTFFLVFHLTDEFTRGSHTNFAKIYLIIEITVFFTLYSSSQQVNG